ncbi:transcriptional activator Hap3p [Diutina catenulata]
MDNWDFEIKEQNRFLPLANVGRVMKAALPPQGKLSKESKECMQECVSEFILFITSQSSDRCMLEKRKTMNGEDILWSMYTLGFEHYAEMLKIYLAKYREYEAEEAAKRPQRIRRKPPKVSESSPEDESESVSEEVSPDVGYEPVYETRGYPAGEWFEEWI